VAQVRADVPPRLPRSLGEYQSGSIAGPRFYASLLGALATIALALALVGVYGTLSYVFEKRAREMGLRQALGATQETLLRYMLLRGMRPVLVGVALGILLALPASRLLESFVFEIEPTDPVTILVTTVAILGTSLLATMIPARRATRQDPMRVLREE
jgi:ABC-type antimicrobial peptide transport system permease subunit